MKCCEGQRGVDPVYVQCPNTADCQVIGMADREGISLSVFFLCDQCIAKGPYIAAEAAQIIIIERLDEIEKPDPPTRTIRGYYRT